MSGGARTLDPWRWLGTPMLQVVIASLLLAIPFRVWGLALPEPVFALPAAFAWAVIRPSVLAPFCVLLLGLFLDHLWGAPIGLWAVSLLIAYGVALAGRSMLAGQNRGVLWAWYGLLSALALGCAYLVTTVVAGTPPNLLATAWQFLATIILYPFADRLIETFEDADVRFR